MSPTALFETHLNVRDLNRSVAFYRDIVGLELVYRLDERHVAFFWIGGRGRTMLGLWSGNLSPNVMRLHIAFSLNLDEVIAAPVTLRAAGIEPLDFFGQPTAEPSVIGWMPAASVFFDDPDGHLLEYVAMLPHVPRPDSGVVSYSDWMSTWAQAEQSGGLIGGKREHVTSPATPLKGS
jgi:lactoylglutathione lyase